MNATSTSRSDAPGTAPADTLVWDVPVRVFHWLLALSFAGAYVTAESERWRDVHVLLGYTVLGLVIFRLLWGVVGTQPARFASFAVGLPAAWRYLQALARRAPPHYAGHNPAGSWAIWLLLVLAAGSSLSGVAVFFDWGGSAGADVHAALSNALLAVAGLHVAAVLLSSVLHRENLVRAMFTGRKRAWPAQGAAARHRVVGLLLLAVVLAFWAGWIPAPGLDRAAGTAPARTDRGTHD
ncbi:MAG: cytochrome b/b6 domain-containing protein [Betaproteobacteria bacterium]|nr:cytochrome b/b6 domain-containing protein [Betaproteobacteria bacterium]